MELIKLFSELQAKPRSVATYKKIAEVYAKLGRSNEASAFQELIQRKFSDNCSDINQKQPVND